MAIPESQLESWSHQGATASSAAAYASVQAAIKASSRLTTRKIEVFLQGSYRNGTNIRGDSDVDVVIQSDSTFFYGMDALREPLLTQAKNSFSPATYQWDEFRSDVLAALVDYYGAGAVKDGNKCITVQSPGGVSMVADVVPAFTYRLYYPSGERFGYVEGISFKTRREGRLVVNYPKQHYKNGVDKNTATSEEFKPTVRMFKNVRTHLVAANKLLDETAPSYFVECLVSNAPDSTFPAGTWETQFIQVYNWLVNASLTDFWCLNHVNKLFGPTPEQWDETKANEYLSQVRTLWQYW